MLSSQNALHRSLVMHLSTDKIKHPLLHTTLKHPGPWSVWFQIQIHTIKDNAFHKKFKCNILRQSTNDKWWCWGNQKDNVHSRSVGLLSPKEAAAIAVQIKDTFLQAFKMDSVLRVEVVQKLIWILKMLWKLKLSLLRLWHCKSG